MKTAKEIEEWLKKQPWINKFKENVIEQIMKGQARSGTICNTFYWTKTPEGDTFWRDINDEFLKWYHGK